MCHIIVIPTNKEINYVQINYPNNEKKNSFMKNLFYKRLFNIFVIICCKKMNFILSELQQFELLQSYQDDALSSVEVQELFLNEIKNIENDIIDLQRIPK